MATIPITTLTPNMVQQSLQNNGLAALGVTAILFSRRWSNANVSGMDFDPNGLTLNLPGQVLAPFLGISANAFRDASSTLAAAVNPADVSIQLAAGTSNSFPAPAGGLVVIKVSKTDGSAMELMECTARSGDTLTVNRGAQNTGKQSFAAGDRVMLRLLNGQRSAEFYELDGTPVNSDCTVLRLHPQAWLRLATMMRLRYAGIGPALTLPVPAAMVVRNTPSFAASRWFRPDEIVAGSAARISFHDERGFIIDPIYVAALFSELIGALPGLVPSNITAAVTDPGGIGQVLNLAPTGNLVHLIDPHGNPPRIRPTADNLITTGAGGGPITGNLITLGAGSQISVADPANTSLRFGFATNGTMGTAALGVPALATGTLNRRFYRVMVVDLPWYLLGNRTNGTVLNIDKDDDRIPAELLPVVRDQIDINYTVDGPDTLAEATRVFTLPNQGMILAVSPAIDASLVTPAAQGPPAHWPAIPPPNTNTPFPVPPPPLPQMKPPNVTANFTAANDVIVTIKGGSAPDGANVRIYPQQFVEIRSINGAEPSFLRADGGAGIVSGANDLKILLNNPFNIGAVRPNPAILTMDIVVTPRLGARRLTANVAVTVGAGPESMPVAPPVTGNPLGAMLVTAEGVSEAPLFGVPKTIAPPPNPPNSVLDWVISLAAEPSPRQSPRLPTMGRLETVAAVGTTGPGAPAPAGTLLWQAVLTGARWLPESRSALHDQANPGNPAGPDLHAPGLSVTGALAYDLALHAIKRTQPIIPLPSTNSAVNPGWVIASAGDNFNLPSDAGNTGNTGSGVLLETVAANCETPWLASQTPPPAGLTVNQMIQDAATFLNVPAPPVNISVPNEPRIQQEIRKEYFAAKYGYRDAQWSLRRAFTEARELIYIDSPQFSRTAYITGAPKDTELDLVAVLMARLAAFSNLRVIICTPRFSDFAPQFENFHRQHYAARLEAYLSLRSVAPDRVLLFHPVGFPGRAAYIRTTSIIVDDVWSLVGATHFRRRGMTFDGSAAIASFDRQITNGYSTKVRNYRRALMAARLRVPAPIAGQPLDGEWVRLGSPSSAFDVVSDLLDQGGYGRIQPIWSGPGDNAVQAAASAVADPDGSDGGNLTTSITAILNALGSNAGSLI